MKRMKMKKAAAFTLVELLVVIAIIGILASIVMPAISGALFKGKMTKESTSARAMYQMVIGYETDAIYTTDVDVWPAKISDDPDAENVFDNSTDYFKYMVTNGIMDVTFGFFAGPGLKQAKGADDFKAANNAWCVTADAENIPITAPFVFTKNIGEGFTTLESSVPEDNGRFDGAKIKPFQSKGFVFVTRGGQSFGLMKDDLKMKNFTNLFDTADAEGIALPNDVLQP